MDAVLDMLRALRLTGGIFLDADFTAPWCVRGKVAPEDCRPFTPQPRQIIAYHYVTAGRLLIKVDGQDPLSVEKGEIVVLPRNDDHMLGSTLTARPLSADHLIQLNPDGGLARIVHGGGGERTQIFCGFLGSNTPHSPIIALLPRVMKLKVAESDLGHWIDSSFRLAVGGLAGSSTTSPAVLAKLAEVMFMEAVRGYLASQPPGAHGWMAGLHDPVVARALGLIHGEVARHWTTDELAGRSGLSRSAFAERFTRVLGEPPMRYLAQQRLIQASVLLRETPDTIARIAYEVGYESEAAFTRAFRREYGVPPAVWRREGGEGAAETHP